MAVPATVGVVAAGGSHTSRRTTSPTTRRARLLAVPFLAPALALVTVLLLLPFVSTVLQSLTDDNGFTSTFVGLRNYTSLVSDPAFAQSVLNTVLWTVGTLILPVGIGLLVAITTSSMRGGQWVRFAFVLPYAISGAATAVIWGFILRSDGALNQALTFLGLPAADAGWLLAWPGNTLVMIIANTWQATGVCVILFMVGLQVVPAETVEAGALDGASGLRLFWHVVFPQLRPVLVVIIGMSIANSLRVFDLIWLLTRGGPGNSSETLAVTMYRQTFVVSDYGGGAAVAVILTVIVVGTSWLYLRRQLRSAS